MRGRRETTEKEIIVISPRQQNNNKKGIDEVRVEIVALAEQVGIWSTKRLLNTCTKKGDFPEELGTGLIVPVWKRKVDMHDPGKYRGITLISHNYVEVAGKNPIWQNKTSSGWGNRRRTTGV